MRVAKIYIQKFQANKPKDKKDKPAKDAGGGGGGSKQKKKARINFIFRKPIQIIPFYYLIIIKNRNGQREKPAIN